MSGGGERAAVLINDRAVGTDQSRKFVLIVGEDNKLDYREVKLGPIVDGLRVVREGVNPGELIVVNGVQRVRPGMLVAPNETQMDAKAGAPVGNGAPAVTSKSGAAS